MNAIQTDSLTKYYGKSRGITDVSLTVGEGDFFGFIGPNGAGKSTTIRILLGLIAPTAGSAEIFGKDIRRQKEAILSEIGYMPSEASFYPHMRVREVIKLSADLRKRDCKKEAAALCDRLSLDTEKRVRELSLGNRKKVSIVCALQHDPRLCILDEPTSGLDPLMQREFFSLLKERNAAGTTIFLSSHVLSEVQRHCRHAAVIRGGRLLLSDSIENLGHTDAKRVTIKGIGEPPVLENIKNMTTDGDTVSFLYRGDTKALLAALAALPLTDVTIADPGLEEIFMHYYDE
ncbi:MAG: ABC transporter ATP-binding protein [Lachnospiraceae bacterium]|nr:ABC transporter ATP-binding protein [Lachnospiraceae bacterium]